MTVYQYKAVKDGKEYEGEKDLLDKGALYSAVRGEGGSIISVKESNSKKKTGGFSFFKGVKNEEKIAFAKNLAVMLEAGISLSRALSIMSKQATNKHLFTILESLKGSIDRGKSFSEAMEDHKKTFSNLFIMMVRSGEESGKIVESLRIVASQLERSNSLTKKVKGAMIYPTIVMIIM